MKKILYSLIFYLFFTQTIIAESYYFKNCHLTDVLKANYLIDIKNNVINVTLETVDGAKQEWSDKIEFIEKNKIVSEKIISSKSDDYYFIYYLDVKSNSVIKQNYKKETGIDLVRPDGPKKQSFCDKVKAGWKISKAKKETVSKKKLKEDLKLFKKDETLPDCKGSDHNDWTDCKGKYTTNDGSEFLGRFKNGKILQGSALYPGGAKYLGQFINEKPHGQGTFTFQDGSKYIGEWKNGEAHGQGIKTWMDGREYAGEFKNDNENGCGTFKYPDGSKYVGQFKDGKRHGEGTFAYADGRTYIGQFVAGLEHGKGTCIDKDGSTIECKILKMKTGDASEEKNRRNISIKAKKWVKLSEYETTAGKGKKIINKLENDFDKKASELCYPSENYDVLEKRIDVLELDETPAFGIETVVKLGINGVVKCK